MLLAVCLALSCTAAGLTVHWALRRVDAIGRSIGFPFVRVGVLGMAAVTAGVPVVTHLQLEQRLSAVAQHLSGRSEVKVSCQNLSQSWVSAHPELGYVSFDAQGADNTAVITYDACRQLASWVRSDHAHPTREQIVAVHVLTHEAMHLSGILDEAQAECAALQRDRSTAEQLGANPSQARTLARTYLETVYPQMPEAYRSAQCSAGADLDEHLPSSPWTS